MTFIVNIHTHETIIEHYFDRKLGHVTKYGKLFCIFPMCEFILVRPHGYKFSMIIMIHYSFITLDSWYKHLRFFLSRFPNFFFQLGVQLIRSRDAEVSFQLCCRQLNLLLLFPIYFCFLISHFVSIICCNF